MDQKDIFAADVLFDFHERLAIREGADRALAQVEADGFGNRARERRIGRASKNFHDLVFIMGLTENHTATVGCAFGNARRTVTMRAGGASGFL